MKKTALNLLLIIAAGFTVGMVYAAYTFGRQETPQSQAVTETPKHQDNEPPSVLQPTELPERVVLRVPFYAQAPFAVWDDIHKEACEEASLHMVRDYHRKTVLDLEEQDQLIINFVRWQTANSYKYDLTLRQLSQAAERYYRFGGAKIIENPTVQEIKEEIAAGRPVIVPAAGRLLDNPNFLNPGPVYHMVVIKGYDNSGFITNDPGTRNGNSFHYRYDNLMTAIHDWNPADITSGAKRVMVYQP